MSVSAERAPRVQNMYRQAVLTMSVERASSEMVHVRCKLSSRLYEQSDHLRYQASGKTQTDGET